MLPNPVEPSRPCGDAARAAKLLGMTDAVASHYGREGILERVLEAVCAAGHDAQALDPDVLAGVDEFHLGSRAATEALAQTLVVPPGAHLLDVGCGVGGPARFFARALDAHVTGVDLTPDFVEVARELSCRTGLAERTRFAVGDGAHLEAADGSFDAVTLIHVGMNVADKQGLFRELRRVTREGGTILVYDILQHREGELRYPMPWAADPETSFLGTREVYVDALEGAGLDVVEIRDQRRLALKALARVATEPPPVHLGHLMGPHWPEMFGHLRRGLEAQVVGPVLIVAHR